MVYKPRDYTGKGNNSRLGIARGRYGPLYSQEAFNYVYTTHHQMQNCRQIREIYSIILPFLFLLGTY